MKVVFLGSRAVVDLLVGRCHHHAVLTESGDWLVVAEIPDVELRQQVLAGAGVLELPHPGSGAAPPQAALDALAAAVAEKAGPQAPVAPPPANTRDFVERTVARLGMPALLEFLDR